MWPATAEVEAEAAVHACVAANHLFSDTNLAADFPGVLCSVPPQHGLPRPGMALSSPSPGNAPATRPRSRLSPLKPQAQASTPDVAGEAARFGDAVYALRLTHGQLSGACDFGVFSELVSGYGAMPIKLVRIVHPESTHSHSWLHSE